MKKIAASSEGIYEEVPEGCKAAVEIRGWN
jgi:hypothetical protein